MLYERFRTKIFILRDNLHAFMYVVLFPLGVGQVYIDRALYYCYNCPVAIYLVLRKQRHFSVDHF